MPGLLATSAAAVESEAMATHPKCSSPWLQFKPWAGMGGALASFSLPL